MGNGASKTKTKKITTVVTATSAFKDAGNRAAVKRDEQNGQNDAQQDGEAGGGGGEAGGGGGAAGGVGEGGGGVGEAGGGGGEGEGGGAGGGEAGGGSVNEQVIPNGEAVKATQEGPAEMGTDQDDEDDLMLSHASLKIQSVFRGYKERQQQKKEGEMAMRIQRRYRRHSSTKKDTDLVSPRSLDTCQEEDNANAKGEQSGQGQSAETTSKTISKKKNLVGVGKQTKDDFIAFQDEITELKWYAEQQLERALCGIEFAGPRIVLVSSKVPKGDLLYKIVRKNVLIFDYDFNKDNFDTILENIRINLQTFKEGCKARSICLYCQGGPGFLYVRRSKVVTVAKLKKECEQDQVRFFKELGKLISKIQPRDSVMHVMGCNIMGNAKGQELFDYLSGLIKPNQVRFEAPLELSPAGVDMIDTYFYFEKYKVWRQHKHSKMDVDL